MASDSQPIAPAETEPLLGRPGDAAQKADAPMITNLYLGTGWLAQVGAVLLLALVWAAVFLNPLIPLFSPHPLLQSVGVVVLTQAVLVVQPTRDGRPKLLGARAHAALNLLALLLFAAGVGVIEANKVRSGNPHFHSVHGYLGVITAAVLLVQATFGFLAWAVPGLFGGVDKARALYRYHRWSGYLLVLLVLATVLSATKTDYVKGVLDIKLWSVAVAVALIIVGIYPRIALSKLGIQRRSA